jgi:hypothetical protein
MPRTKGSTGTNKTLSIRLSETEVQMVVVALKSTSPSPMDVLAQKIDGQYQSALNKAQSKAQDKSPY